MKGGVLEGLGWQLMPILLMQASATWDKFRKERDFHRMHHKRVAQEKNKLIQDMQILKKHYSMVSCTLPPLQTCCIHLHLANPHTLFRV